LEKSFSGATEERANNLSVALSKIGKESDLLLLRIGDQGLTKSINDLADAFGSLTKEGDALLQFLGKLIIIPVDITTGFIKFVRDVANALKFTLKQEINDVNKEFDKLLGKTKDANINVSGTLTSPSKITGISTGLPKKEPQISPILDFQFVIKKIIEDNQDRLDKINDAFLTTAGLTKTITDTLNTGISQFSEKIAESIVLGKQLSDVFKNIGQSLLISILKTNIEILAREILNLFYKKLQTFEIVQQIGKLLEQLAVERAITREQERRASANSRGGGGGGLDLGTIFNIGKSIFGAEGGAIRGGMPITVGERGRELFVPNTSGTIVPNHDLAKMGNHITFNIQANDVRGIRELLIDNRATIINLVNQGANQKGKSNLV
jgi:hypothetical protein